MATGRAWRSSDVGTFVLWRDADGRFTQFEHRPGPSNQFVLRQEVPGSERVVERWSDRAYNGFYLGPGPVRERSAAVEVGAYETRVLDPRSEADRAVVRDAAEASRAFMRAAWAAETERPSAWTTDGGIGGLLVAGGRANTLSYEFAMGAAGAYGGDAIPALAGGFRASSPAARRLGAEAADRVDAPAPRPEVESPASRLGDEVAERTADDAARAASGAERATDGRVSYLDHTEPSGRGLRTGPRAVDKNPNDIDNRRSYELQDEAADVLAQHGYRVEQLHESTSAKTAGIKQPDFRIEGQIFDCYAPGRNSSGLPTSPRNVHSSMQEKLIDSQADRFVLNLDGWGGSIDDLRAQFETWPDYAIREVLIVRGGRVFPL